MTVLTSIAAPATFAGMPWNFLNWGLGPTGTPKNSGVPVRNRPQLYSAGGPVTINQTGPVVKLRFCTATDYDANFKTGEGLLVARDPSGATMPDSVPIMLSFATPLTAVGAYVSVAGDALLYGRALHAVMWVMCTGATDWTPIVADGVVEHALAANAPASAAFVGTVTDTRNSIERICFDASMMGSFETLAISTLHWA